MSLVKIHVAESTHAHTDIRVDEQSEGVMCRRRCDIVVSSPTPKSDVDRVLKRAQAHVRTIHGVNIDDAPFALYCDLMRYVEEGDGSKPADDYMRSPTERLEHKNKLNLSSFAKATSTSKRTTGRRSIRLSSTTETHYST